tara:strand:- start:6221 stop:8779 length:2559 start_codon:yes stop_codon:yes gene_type:complete
MKSVVFTFGRMNPPTAGHAKLVEKMRKEARTNRADVKIYLSHSQDKKKNPLDYKSKIKHAKRAFGNRTVVNSRSKNVGQVVQELDKKYDNCTMVVGSDRVDEFKKMLETYNGRDWNFDKVKVVSAGDRDPDGEGVSGMSATKMRDSAAKGDFNTFKRGVAPGVDADALYDDVRNGMEIIDMEDEFHEEDISDEELDLFVEFLDLEELDEELDSDDELGYLEEMFDEALSFQQRIKRGRLMRRLAPRMKRLRKMRKFRMAPKSRLEYRAKKSAINFMRKRLAGDRGANYKNLSIAQKISIDKMLDKRRGSGILKRIARRLMPKIRKKEMNRLKSVRKARSQKEQALDHFIAMQELEEARRGRPKKNPTGDEDEGIENFIMQLRKVISLRGMKPVEFEDGKKVKLTVPQAQAAMSLYNKARTSIDKGRVMNHMAMSKKEFDNALKGKNPPKKMNPLTFKMEGVEEATQKPYVSSDRDGHHVLDATGSVHKSFPKNSAGMKAAQQHMNKHYDKLKEGGMKRTASGDGTKTFKKKPVKTDEAPLPQGRPRPEQSWDKKDGWKHFVKQKKKAGTSSSATLNNSVDEATVNTNSTPFLDLMRLMDKAMNEKPGSKNQQKYTKEIEKVKKSLGLKEAAPLPTEKQQAGADRIKANIVKKKIQQAVQDEDIERAADQKRVKIKKPDGTYVWQNRKAAIDIGKGKMESRTPIPSALKDRQQDQKDRLDNREKQMRVRHQRQRNRAAMANVRKKNASEALEKKANETGIKLSIIEQIYNDGVRMHDLSSDKTSQQVGFDRVNAYIAQVKENEIGTAELRDKYASETPGQNPGGIKVAFKDYVHKPEIAPTARQIQQQEKKNG